MICSVHATMKGDDSAADVQVYTALGTGLAMITLSTIFLPVSGAHINPAISLAAAIIRKVSPARAAGRKQEEQDSIIHDSERSRVRGEMRKF